MGSVPGGPMKRCREDFENQPMANVPGGSKKRRHEDFESQRTQNDTSWMRAQEIVLFLKEGDLIEFDRDLYKHCGVFVKYFPQDRIYYVVHLSGDLTDELLFASSSSSSKGEKSVGKSLGDSLQFGGRAVVRMDDLIKVAAGGRCRVNNGRDTDFTPYPPEWIVERAMGELNKDKYNALVTNCEHFATWCRYGTKQSRQSTIVKSIITGIGVGIASWSGSYGVMGTAAVYAGSWLGHRLLNKLGWGNSSW